MLALSFREGKGRTDARGGDLARRATAEGDPFWPLIVPGSPMSVGPSGISTTRVGGAPGSRRPALGRRRRRRAEGHLRKGPIGFAGAIEDGLGGCAGVRDEPVCRRAAVPASVDRVGEHASRLGSQAGLEAVAPGSCRSACGEMDVFDASGTMSLNGPKSLDSRSHCGRGYGLVVHLDEDVRFGSSARTTPRLTAIPRRAQAGGDASQDAPRSCRGFSSAYRAKGPSASSRVLGRRLCRQSRETSLGADSGGAIVSDCRVGQLPWPPITAYVTSGPHRNANGSAWEANEERVPHAVSARPSAGDASRRRWAERATDQSEDIGVDEDQVVRGISRAPSTHREEVS
jgi:hypothetical protein